MKTFTFSKLTKMGEFDEKYGQSYWGETNEQLDPVKFNSMNQNITADDSIEVEDVLLKTSAKGTDYHQLKKVKVLGGTSTVNVSRTQTTQIERPAANQTQHNEIMEMLQKILNAVTEQEESPAQSGYEQAKQKADSLREPSEPAYNDSDAPYDFNAPIDF